MPVPSTVSSPIDAVCTILLLAAPESPKQTAMGTKCLAKWRNTFIVHTQITVLCGRIDQILKRHSFPVPVWDVHSEFTKKSVSRCLETHLKATFALAHPALQKSLQLCPYVK